MALSCGFYSSDPTTHDRKYNAEQLSQIFDGIISDGVYATYGDHFVVKASATDSEVIVPTGRAWFNHTWTLNDADLPVTAPEPGVILDRIDALCLDINSDIATRENTLVWIQGDESTDPVKPESFEHTDTHNQYPLCFVTRRAGATTITQADIENAVGTELCPFVTGIIETINTSELLLQWGAEYDQWMSANRSTFVEWFEELQVILDGDVAANLAGRILTLEDEFTANGDRLYMDYHDGKYGVNTSSTRGADTFIPFKRAATDHYSFDPAEMGAEVDLGEDHQYRYVEATQVFLAGVAKGAAGDTAEGKIKYTYHHHTIDSTNNNSPNKTGGLYPDTYGAVSSGGCFTEPRTVQTGTNSGTRKVTVELSTVSDSSGNVYKRCSWCGGTATGGTYDHVYHTHYESYSTPVYGTRYFCTCGKKDGQCVSVEIVD